MSWQSLAVAALIVCTSSLVAAPALETKVNAKADLEEAAEKLPFLFAEPLNVDTHWLRGLPDEMADTYRKQVGKIGGERYDVKELLELLHHDKPRVRTLAAVILFSRLDPKVLPHLVPLAKDPAETFPSLQPIARAAFPLNRKAEPPPMQKQTVGEIVTRLMNQYLSAAGYHYGIDGRDKHPGFDDYWAKRKDRAHCASWFMVQVRWAAASTIPTPKDRVAAVKAVRKRIDQVAEPDRTFILLCLRDDPGRDVAVSEAELVESCKKLGPEPLLKLLQRKIPSDDPDLQPRGTNNGLYNRMMMFVLERPGQLLRPQDAEALQACEKQERDDYKKGVGSPLKSPAWFIAPAELQPAKAKEVLKAGWAEFQDKYDADNRAKLALSWWRLASEGDPAFVVKWFYEEQPQRGQFYHCRAWLIRNLKPTAADRKLLAALVTDKRFAELDWQSLDQMVQLVNAWEKKPVVEEEARRKAWHPTGMGHFHWEMDRMKQQYPKETTDLLNTLDAWRKALRERLAP